MADKEWTLVHKETGDERKFTDRSEYLAVKYSGGWRDKPSTGRRVEPEQPRPRRERREPVNDTPTVEHPTAE